MSSSRERIKDLQLVHVPLSTGELTVGVVVRLDGGIEAWDASPIGTTTSPNDPQNLSPEHAREPFVQLRRALLGRPATDQEGADRTIETVLSQDIRGIIGVNLAVATSLAVCRAASARFGLPLCRYVASYLGRTDHKPTGIMSNVLGGGGHHSNALRTTELMVISSEPPGRSVGLILDVRRRLAAALQRRGYDFSVGLEGSLVVAALDDHAALGALQNVLGEERLSGDHLGIGLDLAGRAESKFVDDLLSNFTQIEYVEDPYSVTEASRYRDLLHRLPELLVAGDDLIAGRVEYLGELLKRSYVNAVVIKLNHFGTLSRIAAAADLARDHNATIVMSQRSQETARDTLAHLALALGADYLKAGSPVRERISNYSSLIAHAGELM